jgi:hypothetical protein
MIPFHTLSQRHLVYAYCAVWLLQFGYAAWLTVQWRKTPRDPRLAPPVSPPYTSE